jgi:GxxExxY protein
MKTDYDLAGRVIGLAMKVHSTLGAGFLESVYQQALMHELTKAQIKFEAEKPLKVFYDGIIVGDFIADLVAENELIVELKAIQQLSAVHDVQVVNYLIATGIDTGLLLNFGGERLEYRKKFRLPKAKIHSENFVHSV